MIKHSIYCNLSMMMVFPFSFKYKYPEKFVGEWEDDDVHSSCQHCDFDIND